MVALFLVPFPWALGILAAGSMAAPVMNAIRNARLNRAIKAAQSVSKH